MFKEIFNPTVTNIDLSRAKGDEDTGVKVVMSLKMQLEDDHADDLGATVKALIDARLADDGARVHPFSKVQLDVTYSDLALTVYDGKGVKFEALPCTASGLALVKSKDDPCNAVLTWKVSIPPVKWTDLQYLIAFLQAPEPIKLKLAYRQQEMDVDPPPETDGDDATDAA